MPKNSSSFSACRLLKHKQNMAKQSDIEKFKKKQKFSSRQVSRCSLCGRSRAYMRKFGLCRICFRERAYKGELPGVVKASW